MKRNLFYIVLFCVFWLGNLSVFAQSNIDALKEALNKTGNNSEKVIILNQLSNALVNNNPQEALRYSHSAISAARKVNDKKGEATGYFNLGNASNASNRTSQANDAFHTALDLYEGVYYKTGDGEALRGICESYSALSKWYKNQNENEAAEQYQNLYQNYNKRFQALYAGMENRLYGSSNVNLNPTITNPNNPNSPNNSTNPNNPTVDIPLVDEKLLNEFTKDDSLLLLAKELQIKKLRQDKNQKESQITNLTQENITKEEELDKQKSSKTWWIAGLSALLIGALGFAFHHRQQQYGSTVNQKTKLAQFGERINRQEVFLREQNDVLKKKETELVALYGQLDDAKIETNSLTQILNREIKPQLDSIINTTEGDKIDNLLLHQTGIRLMNLVNSTVDVQNFEKAKPILAYQKTSIAKIAEQALAQFSELIKQKNILVENKINPSHLAFFDVKMMERIFLNLLDNSLKYTPQNGKISLDSTPIEEYSRHFVKVSLQDTGKSIPASSLPLVFEKFSPEDARPSGMGLHFVKLMIEQHNGQVAVLSKEGYGTSFIFTLPTEKQV